MDIKRKYMWVVGSNPDSHEDAKLILFLLNEDGTLQVGNNPTSVDFMPMTVISFDSKSMKVTRVEYLNGGESVSEIYHTATDYPEYDNAIHYGNRKLSFSVNHILLAALNFESMQFS